MNKKQFEIYKEWRRKKYQRDLEKKQDELASRGMASSGLRNKEEKWLIEEYQADIDSKEAESEENLQRSLLERRTSLNQRITNWVLALASIAALSLNMWIYRETVKKDEQLNRPYFSVASLEVVPSTFQSADYRIVITTDNQGLTRAVDAKLMYRFSDSDWPSNVATFDVGPKAEGGGWIPITRADIDSIDKASSTRRLVIRTTYSSVTGELFCRESQYSSIFYEEDYFLPTEKSYDCSQSE